MAQIIVRYTVHNVLVRELLVNELQHTDQLIWTCLSKSCLNNDHSLLPTVISMATDTRSPSSAK